MMVAFWVHRRFYKQFTLANNGKTKEITVDRSKPAKPTQDHDPVEFHQQFHLNILQHS